MFGPLAAALPAALGDPLAAALPAALGDALAAALADPLALPRVQQQLPQAAPFLEGIQRGLEHLVSDDAFVCRQQPEGGIVSEQAVSHEMEASEWEREVVCEEDVEDWG